MRTKYKEGGVLEMISIALPMVVALACDTVMVFTDRFMLARLSPELMNSALGGGLTSFMMTTFFIGLTGYSTALVAQYLGAGKKNYCSKVVFQALLIALCGYPIILLCRPLAYRFFDVMEVPSGQLAPQILYFNILVFGTIVSLLRNCFSAFFSGVGRTRVVMLASCAAMIVNVGLNYILIYGKFGCPALGIAGAAYGTILGGFTGLLILLFAYLKRANRLEFVIARSFAFNKEVMKKLLRYGYPAGLEFFLNMLAFNSMVMVFQSLGAATATASSIMFNWDMVSFVPLVGVEIGVTSLVGRAMGASNPKLAHLSVLSGLKLGAVYSFVILMLFVGFPALLVNVFAPSGGGVEIFSEAVPLAIFMVRVAAIYVLIETLFLVFIGALRGAGDTFWAMCLSVSLHWTMAITAYFMLRVFDATPSATWVVMVALFFASAGLVYWRYASGKWKNLRIVQPEVPELAIDTFHERADI